MSLRDLTAALPPSPRKGRGLVRLTAGLAHTVNNALTGTVGHLDLALRQVAPGSAIHSDLRAALACTHRAAAAVRQFVAFATAPGHVQGIAVSLREIAEQAADAAREFAPAGVIVNTIGDRPARVAARPALVAVAVEQIVRNAVESMPDGGRLILETEEGSSRCKLWVRDSGPGLPAEVQEHLFEPFVTTKSFTHIGLGLALAFELVQALDGTLSISSCAGFGTTVLFSFPAWKDTDEESWTESPQGEPILSATTG